MTQKSYQLDKNIFVERERGEGELSKNFINQIIILMLLFMLVVIFELLFVDRELFIR